MSAGVAAAVPQSLTAVTDSSHPAVGLTVQQLLTAEARCAGTPPTAGRRNVLDGGE